MIFTVGGVDPNPGFSMFCPPGESRPFELDIETADDFELYAESANADVTIWAKAEPGDSFVNIVATPIDLSGYFPTRKQFYFELRVAIGYVQSPDGIDFEFPELFVARS